MAFYLAPIGNEQQVDANGDPVVGGKIYTYLAGTTTPAPTYTDDTGGTPQANPIILNSLGIPASPIWLQGGQAYKFAFTDSNDVQTRPTVDDITGINDPAFASTADQWVVYPAAPTFLSATSFSLVGDQTNIFQVSRRLRTINTGGTTYSTVESAVFGGGNTTVTVKNTSGVLDSGLSQVSYGLLSSDNSSIPTSFDGYNIISTPYTRNIVRNGSFAVAQRTMPTTDNAFAHDGWRLLLGAANAAVPTQDTATVPTGAGYAAVLTVGAGNNNKFGLFQPIPNKDMLCTRGGVVSIRVPLAATAGLTNGTGKIRIGIMQWTGTADAITADPISAWNAEGTNPTLIANWAFANTPAALSVGTTFSDFLVENVSIAANATNLGVLIWCDETSTTTTTDILRIGGYVTMGMGETAPLPQVADYFDELRRCTPHYRLLAQMIGSAVNTTAGAFSFQYEEMLGTISGTAIDSSVDLQVAGSTSNISGTWGFTAVGPYGGTVTFTRSAGTWTAGNQLAVAQVSPVVAMSNGIF